jgi:two-component system, LuxR family, sensor kinase FixL
LAGLGMIAYSLFESLQAKSAPEAKTAARLSEGIGRALDNVRTLARELVPSEVQAHGLRSALAELARQSAELHKIDCAFAGDDLVSVGDEFVATHLYRIAQEALTNALKHAAARRIQLSLREVDGLITLEVQDDGRGIDDSPPGGAGIGLKVMFYRAGLIGGALRIVRLDAGGTLVLCKVPRT